jgi:diacylglycerol kinase family enzyme
MNRFDRAWLVVNAASGSNNPAALEELHQCLADNGIAVARTISFPDDDLPDPAALDAAGIPLVVIYTGDGTLNATLTSLKGWSGAVLVLPGGTMNLLSKRLHGDFPTPEIVAVFASGGARRRRVLKIVGDCGDAYAGLLAGPGTHWGNVREAMRELDIAAVASGTAEALAASTGETAVRAVEPPLGRREGYPLIDMTPGEHGIQVNGYAAATAGEIAQQGWALLRRRFREGPHDRLGIVETITLENVDGSAVEVLLDGERCNGAKSMTFRVAESEVDLLATHHA